MMTSFLKLESIFILRIFMFIRLVKAGNLNTAKFFREIFFLRVNIKIRSAI